MNLLCFFGHHRSASSWTNDILRTISVAAGWRHEVVHNAAMFDHDLKKFYTKTRPDLLTFTNAKWSYLADLPSFMGLHVVRDPRDILVSSYFSHRNSHPTTLWPELAIHRKELQALSEAEGLLLELECRREEFEDMAAWHYGAPNIYELKMELFTQAPEQHFVDLFRFWQRLAPAGNQRKARMQVTINQTARRIERRMGWGYRLPRWQANAVWPWLLQEVIAANAFEKKSGGRSSGEVDLHHHYRAGTPGHWRNYFSPELTARFKENYNDLLVQLGYETSKEW